MNGAWAARLREASVVLSQPQLEHYRAAVEKLAKARAPAVPDQLARLRLAFAMRVDSEESQRFDDQLAQAGAEIRSRDEQLRRVLAACVLVSRFARGQARRKRSSLSADSLAALAARSLTWSGVQPTHPDVSTWARYWIENISQDLRSGLQIPDRPELELDDPVRDPDAPDRAAQQSLQRWLEQLRKFADELAIWSTELNPAHIAAQDEQLALLWWLESREPQGSAEDGVATAARQLAGRTQVIPGPPRADQLLVRRLRQAQSARIKMSDLLEIIEEKVPPEVSDLCPLLARSDRVTDLEVPAALAARWLFNELLFVRLHADPT